MSNTKYTRPGEFSKETRAHGWTGTSEQLALLYQPPQPIEENAANLFIFNFVLVPPQGTERGYFQFIIPLVIAGQTGSCLKLAFEACALAYFNNRTASSAALETQSVVKYVKALVLTRKALRDTCECHKDATIASVLLLGLFEVITARHSNMLAWSFHTEGAIKLLQKRGKEQLRAATQKDIFVTVRTQQILHSISAGKPAEQGVGFWIKDAVKDRYAADLQRIMLEIIELNGETHTLVGSPYRSPKNITAVINHRRKCEMKDLELLQWARSLPESHQCRAITWVTAQPHCDYSHAEVFPGRVDGFPDLWSSSVWIMMRCARLILACTIIRSTAWVCSPADYRTTSQYAIWSGICKSTIDDICAAIPYQLGWFQNRKELLKRPGLSSSGCRDDASARGLSGYLATWPLSCIMTQDSSTENHRIWAKGRLTYIATHLGVNYARILLKHVTVRVPSMLIARDFTAANANVHASVVDKILFDRIAPPSGLTARVLSVSGRL